MYLLLDNLLLLIAISYTTDNLLVYIEYIMTSSYEKDMGTKTHTKEHIAMHVHRLYTYVLQCLSLNAVENKPIIL